MEIDIITQTMKSNNWPYAYTIGRIDGQRDRIAGLNKQIPINERTDYAYGYHKGYSV